MSTGVHIVFEGPEAVGKSTQIARTVKFLEEQGRIVTLTREPGSTELGKMLRNILLDSDLEINARAEALLMAADRAHDVSEVIVPALQSGNVVLSDRYVPSSLVYQGVVRGLGVEVVAQISEFACSGHNADITICFDLDDDHARARAKAEPDRMEREGEQFHQKVRDAYRELTQTFGWNRIDAMGSEDEVFARIVDLITPLL